MLFEELVSDRELYACLSMLAERKSMCRLKNSGSMLYLLPMADTQDGEMKPRMKTNCPKPVAGTEVAAKEASCCS